MQSASVDFLSIYGFFVFKMNTIPYAMVKTRANVVERDIWKKLSSVVAARIIP